jgi:hypothetical protein
MKIKVNVSVFLGVVLCVALVGSMWLLRNNDVSKDAAWNPNQMYNGLWDSPEATPVGHSSGAVSSHIVRVPKRTIPIRYRRVYPYMPSPVTSALPTNSSSVVVSPISYRTSSATYHSFGGGSSMISGVFGGGSRRTSNVADNVATSSIVPSVLSTNTPARTNHVSQTQLVLSSPAVFSVVPATNTYSSSYSCIGYSSIYNEAIGNGMTVSGVSSAGPRYAPGMGGLLEDWLIDNIGGDAYMQELYDQYGIHCYNEQLLYELYLQAIANGELPEGMSWDDFCEWLSGQTDYAFPISGGVWFMCFLALGYGFYIAYRRKQKVVNS